MKFYAKETAASVFLALPSLESSAGQIDTEQSLFPSLVISLISSLGPEKPGRVPGLCPDSAPVIVEGGGVWVSTEVARSCVVLLF